MCYNMRPMAMTELNLGTLPYRKTSLGVPLQNGNILLGDTGRVPEQKSRIVVSRKSGVLYVCRVDGEPIQITRIYPYQRYQLGLIDQAPLTKSRKVLKDPLAVVALEQVDQSSWLFDGEFADPEHGPEDLGKFFNKIASVSLGKVMRTKIGLSVSKA